MARIPKTENTLLLRTCFSDDKAWTSLCLALQRPVGEFRAYVTPISDRAFDGATVEQVAKAAAGAGHVFAFIADGSALTDPEHAVLVIDLLHDVGRGFRVIPSEAWGVENNLSIGNMDFDEFAEAVDRHGVFRGFPE